MNTSVAFCGGVRESFSGKPPSMWLIVGRRRLPTPPASPMQGYRRLHLFEQEGDRLMELGVVECGEQLDEDGIAALSSAASVAVRISATGRFDHIIRSNVPG